VKLPNRRQLSLLDCAGIIYTENTGSYAKNNLTAKLYPTKIMAGAGVPIQVWGLKDRCLEGSGQICN